VKTKLLLALLLLSAVTSAQTYSPSTLATFPSITKGPVFPTGGLIIDSGGNLYGSAQGGTNSLGALFKVTPKGVLSVLFNFNGSNGSYPSVNLLRDKAGNIYGTTLMGGTDNTDCFSGCGSVFKLIPAGKLTVLHSFTGGEAYPSALTLDAAGNLYGFSFVLSSSPNGSVFKITPAGTFSRLYEFCSLANCADGSGPNIALIVGKDGNFYGTTGSGGEFGFGTVFKLTPAGEESVVYNFTEGADGATPVSGLTEDTAGNMYGVTYAGGTSAPNTATLGPGTVFKVTPAGAESVLYTFCQSENCTDGNHPFGPFVSVDSQGNIDGTTGLGGAKNGGVVFKVTPQGTESVLRQDGIDSDGGNGVALDTAGNVYVELNAGGNKEEGSVLKLTRKAD
jgi:uncharacterized repeat protein (TIGR03803 family)